jgi:hypothetical protein
MARKRGFRRFTIVLSVGTLWGLAYALPAQADGLPGAPATPSAPVSASVSVSTAPPAASVDATASAPAASVSVSASAEAAPPAVSATSTTTTPPASTSGSVGVTSSQASTAATVSTPPATVSTQASTSSNGVHAAANVGSAQNSDDSGSNARRREDSGSKTQGAGGPVSDSGTAPPAAAPAAGPSGQEARVASANRAPRAARHSKTERRSSPAGPAVATADPPARASSNAFSPVRPREATATRRVPLPKAAGGVDPTPPAPAPDPRLPKHQDVAAGPSGSGASSGFFAISLAFLLLATAGWHRWLRRHPDLHRPPALRFLLERPG